MSEGTPSGFLLCPMCLELMSVPVSLPCGHVFCCSCLYTMGKGLDQFTCPDCHKEYQPLEYQPSQYQQGTINLAPNQKINSNGNRIMMENVPCVKFGSDREASTKMEEQGIDRSVEYQSSPLLTAADHQQNSKIGESKSKLESRVASKHQDVSSAVQRKEKKGVAKKENYEFLNKSPLLEDLEVDDEVKRNLGESKFKLAANITELSLELEQAEGVLIKEQEYELNITTANAKLREKASSLLGDITSLAQRYSQQVMQLIDNELGPGEASVKTRVASATEMANKIRQAMLLAESLLTEQDANVFTRDKQSLELEIGTCEVVELPEETLEIKSNLTKACPELEQLNSEFRDRIGEIQRSLRNVFNPSEVTFDPETAHPNLVLSEDLKTVTFSAKKQPYQTSPKRFNSFFQVLSAQSFSEGDHSWEVQLEGAPWMIGVCCGDKLPRTGLPSALESNSASWCLMWNNNLLTAFDQSKAMPLKKTSVAHRLEIRLTFKSHCLSVYNISASSGRSLVHTFNSVPTEPLQLAFRMLSGDPRGRVTICT